MPKHNFEEGDDPILCDSSKSSETVESNDDPRLENPLLSWYFLGLLKVRRVLDEVNDDHDAEDGFGDRFVAEEDTLVFLRLFLGNRKRKRLDLE